MYSSFYLNFQFITIVLRNSRTYLVHTSGCRSLGVFAAFDGCLFFRICRISGCDLADGGVQNGCHLIDLLPADIQRRNETDDLGARIDQDQALIHGFQDDGAR